VKCIWITTDSFRQDHVNGYRPEGTLDATGESMKVDTPNLDKLMREGVAFDRMLSEALPTVPCRRGYFTGRRVFPWPDEPKYKGIYPDFPAWRPLAQEDVSVAEHLGENGYVCAMVGDGYHLMKPSMNMHRGFHGFHWVRGQEFDLWNTQPVPEEVLKKYSREGDTLDTYRNRVLTQFIRNHMYVKNDEDLPAPRTFRWAIEWLERNREHDDFFLYIDTFSPHEPWLPPQRLVDRYDPDWAGPKLIYGNPYRRSQLSDEEHHHLRARYAGCCTMVDEWIGKLLAAIRKAKTPEGVFRASSTAPTLWPRCST